VLFLKHNSLFIYPSHTTGDAANSEGRLKLSQDKDLDLLNND